VYLLILFFYVFCHWPLLKSLLLSEPAFIWSQILFCLLEGNASLGKTTYVHCKAGRGRSTTIVICYLVCIAINPRKTFWAETLFLLFSDHTFSTQVQHKNMTPEAAYSYVRSIRPRVLLAAAQWKVSDRGPILHHRWTRV